MKQLARLTLPLLVFPMAAFSAEIRREKAPESDRIEQVSFDSKVLGTRKRFCVVLPDGYERDRGNHKVLYLFHGRGRHERSLIASEKARKALLAAPFVVVLPDGDDGWYVNSPVRPKDRYADYIDETIKIAERAYRLGRDPKDRALSGWSMGGYGCVSYAVAHPGEFISVAPIIGLLDFPRDGLPEGQSYKVPTARFGTDRRIWAEFNPIHKAGRLQGMNILLITGDEAFDRTMNENFHAQLEKLGIEHGWKVLEGGHQFHVVEGALPLVIEHTRAAFE